MLSSSLGFRRNSDGTYEVKDYITHSEYRVGSEIYKIMRRMNGKTSPYSIRTHLSRGEATETVEWLMENNLIRTSRVLFEDGGTKAYTLFVPKFNSSHRVIAFFLNIILMFGWLPLLVVGSYVFINNASHVNDSMMFVGYLVGLVMGIVLHELGHATSGLAYGARVFEFGVQRMYYILPGAYVLMDEDNVKSRLRRAQINAAGAEVNFALCGLFLLCTPIFYTLNGMFLNAAICNLVLGLLNLTIYNGLDGAHVLGNLLGDDEIVNKAKAIVFNKKARSRLYSKGASGVATVAVYGLLNVAQLSFPILCILNIVEVIRSCVL